jgi:hypothetical protein
MIPWRRGNLKIPNIDNRKPYRRLFSIAKTWISTIFSTNWTRSIRERTLRLPLQENSDLLKKVQKQGQQWESGFLSKAHKLA